MRKSFLTEKGNSLDVKARYFHDGNMPDTISYEGQGLQEEVEDSLIIHYFL